MKLIKVKTQYTTDVFKLCGYSITRTHEATGMWPEEIKRYLSIDHKTPVVPMAAVTVDPWKTVEREFVIHTYKKHEYYRLDTQEALGISASGLVYKLTKLGALKKAINTTPIQVFISASAFTNIHDWWASFPDMVQAAYRLSAMDEIKKELGW